jgi:hypothetical protein
LLAHAGVLLCHGGKINNQPTLMAIFSPWLYKVSYWPNASRISPHFLPLLLKVDDMKFPALLLVGLVCGSGCFDQLFRLPYLAWVETRTLFSSINRKQASISLILLTAASHNSRSQASPLYIL